MGDPEGNEFCVAALCPRATEPTEPEWSASLRGQRRSDFAPGRRQLVRRNAPMAAMESSCVVIV
jgi:hypothetical protein